MERKKDGSWKLKWGVYILKEQKRVLDGQKLPILSFTR